jgi:hypothetical protein
MFGASSIPFWAAITAIAGVGQVILLTVTAVFVYRYLRETERLRIAANEQLEAQIRPALTVDGRAMNLRVVNVGSGTALNLRLVKRNPDGGVDFAPRLKGSFIAPGESQMRDTWERVGSIGTMKGEVLDLFYESLSGKEYASVIKFEGNGNPCEARFYAKGQGQPFPNLHSSPV